MEHGGAILLFDEGDALSGKHSEVKDSHDRYANIDINYLVQRTEEFSGLAILATNMKMALDPAFLQRDPSWYSLRRELGRQACAVRR